MCMFNVETLTLMDDVFVLSNRIVVPWHKGVLVTDRVTGEPKNYKTWFTAPERKELLNTRRKDDFYEKLAQSGVPPNVCKALKFAQAV